MPSSMLDFNQRWEIIFPSIQIRTSLAPDCDYVEVVGSSNVKTFNTLVTLSLRSQPCVVIWALPEKPVSIHTFVTIVFAERGYPFGLFIYTLKVFSFTALADNLKGPEEQAWQKLKRHLPLLINRCVSLFLNWASHLHWLVQTDVLVIILTDVLTFPVPRMKNTCSLLQLNSRVSVAVLIRVVWATKGGGGL